MQPLKVTFTFTSPVALAHDHPIHLDGLLAWALADDAENCGSDDPWKDAEDLSFLDKFEAPSGDWVWKASMLHFVPATERFFMNMVRRLEPEKWSEAFENEWIDTRRPRSSINSGSGHERAYQLLMTYQWMHRAEAWCIGEIDSVVDLLSRVTALGKMTRNGFGLVNQIDVCPDQEAEDKWRQRFLPKGVDGAAGLDYAESYRRLHAPYWKKSSRLRVQVPILV